MYKPLNNAFAEIFGDVINFAANSQQIIKDCTVERREIIAPSSVLKVERRLYDDEFAFADRATWLDAHQITQDRRKPRNIVNEANHSDECLSLIRASGECCCEQQGAE